MQLILPNAHHHFFTSHPDEKLSESKLTEAEIEGILGEVKQKKTDRVIFKNEQLYRFFHQLTSEQMRREILEILKSWRNSNWI
ncbi:MAG: hypothetical protein ACLRRF_07950 [Clostridium fessum]